MDNFSRLLNRLGTSVLSSQVCAPGIAAGSMVELLDRQKQLRTNVIYLGTAKQIPAVLADAILEPATVLICCECRKPVLSTSQAARIITYVETSMPLNRVFNHLQQIMRPSLLADAPDSETAQLTQLWQSFMEQKILVREQAADAMRALNIPVTNRIRLLLLRYDSSRTQWSMQELLRQLRALIPNSCIFPYNGDILILFFNESDKLAPIPQSLLSTQLTELLNQLDGYLICSNRTRQYEMLPTLYRLCARVAELNLQLDLEPRKRVLSYDRYANYHILDLAVQRFIQIHGHSNVIYLANPAVVILTRYDSQHNTNLRDVLFYYLLNNGNITKTAEATFMHRNTVLKKLKKINELLELDLQDSILRQQLLTSCQLLRYYEQFWGQSLQL